MIEVKKAIIPIAGLATRFLPLSRVVPKELLPLADKPIIQYIIEEAKNSGIEEIIFVLSPNNKKVLDYLKPSSKLEKILKEKKKKDILEEVRDLDDLFRGITFNYVLQKEPLGDGHAILQAAKLVKDEPVACMFGDDIINANVPGIAQLEKVFKTCEKPVIGLYKPPKEKLSSYGIVNNEKIANRLHKIKGIIEKPKLDKIPSDLAIVGRYILTPEVFYYLKKAKPVIGLYKPPKEKLSSYGIVKNEKIANRLHKIKGIVEKPKPDKIPSDLAIVGRYILTPEVFYYLKKAKPSEKGEIILAEVFNNQMLKEGKLIYGYEIDGEWFECGDKIKWLKSNLYFSLNHPKYGAELKKYLKIM